jgi:hypothetical protein
VGREGTEVRREGGEREMSVVKVIHPRVDPPLVVRHISSVLSLLFRLVLPKPFLGSSLPLPALLLSLICPSIPLHTAPFCLFLSQFPLLLYQITLLSSLKSCSI